MKLEYNRPKPNPDDIRLRFTERPQLIINNVPIYTANGLKLLAKIESHSNDLFEPYTLHEILHAILNPHIQLIPSKQSACAPLENNNDSSI